MLISAPGCSLSGGACGEPPLRFAPLGVSHSKELFCSCVYKYILKKGVPRRMPFEKNIQVVGTLIPQESRTLRSNQLVNDALFKCMSNKLLSF
jgi:hypothetical protein